MEQVTVSRQIVAAVIAEVTSSPNSNAAPSAAVAALKDAIAQRPVAPALYVNCFGSFQIFHARGGQSPPPPAAKRGRELMQYLVLHPTRPASRERLGELFWPGLDGEGVKHRLHIAASGARAFLRPVLDGFDAIRSVSDGYAWHRDVRIESDVARFETLYREGSISAFKDAVALYAGELFEGEESDWLQRERIKYSSMYASMLERLARKALTEGDAESALGYGLDLLGLDRAHEGAAQLVMQCFGELGRRSRAVAEYESLRAYLKRHLGVEPMPETQRQIRTIMGWTDDRAPTAVSS
jgi:DNA-binding SARP family transcriptional activator